LEDYKYTSVLIILINTLFGGSLEKGELKKKILQNNQACLMLWEIQNVKRTLNELGLKEDSQVNTGGDAKKHDVDDVIGNLMDLFMDFFFPEMNDLGNDEYFKLYDLIVWDIFMKLRLRELPNKFNYYKFEYYFDK